MICALLSLKSVRIRTSVPQCWRKPRQRHLGTQQEITMSEYSPRPNYFVRSASYENQKITVRFDAKRRVLDVDEMPAGSPAADSQSLASLIDSTLLKPDATEAQISQLCQDAIQYRFFAVCINPYWVPLCAHLLAGSEVRIATVVGFPLGATSTGIKVFETKRLISLGADEVDMVMNIGEMKQGNLTAVATDMREVVRAAHKRQALVKVIIETCLLSEAEKIKACLIAKDVGVDFVKTSTGFSGPGATTADVTLMRAVVGSAMGVKAAGGIRSLDEARQMVAAGASRIGTSAGVKIVMEEQAS